MDTVNRDIKLGTHVVGDVLVSGRSGVPVAVVGC